LKVKLETSVEKHSTSKSKACLHGILPGFCIANLLIRGMITAKADKMLNNEH